MAVAGIADGILRALRSGDFGLTKHAQERMAQRNVLWADLVHLGTNAQVSEESEGKFRVSGADLDGEPLTAVVVYEYGVLIITVF